VEEVLEYCCFLSLSFKLKSYFSAAMIQFLTTGDLTFIQSLLNADGPQPLEASFGKAPRRLHRSAAPIGCSKLRLPGNGSAGTMTRRGEPIGEPLRCRLADCIGRASLIQS
jgi:hypothetical protein